MLLILVQFKLVLLRRMVNGRMVRLCLLVVQFMVLRWITRLFLVLVRVLGLQLVDDMRNVIGRLRWGRGEVVMSLMRMTLVFLLAMLLLRLLRLLLMLVRNMSCRLNCNSRWFS